MSRKKLSWTVKAAFAVNASLLTPETPPGSAAAYPSILRETRRNFGLRVEFAVVCIGGRPKHGTSSIPQRKPRIPYRAKRASRRRDCPSGTDRSRCREAPRIASRWRDTEGLRLRADRYDEHAPRSENVRTVRST